MSRKGAILDVDGTLTRGFYIKKFPRALYESGEFSPGIIGHMAGVFIKYKSGKISYEEVVPIAVDLFARGVEGKKQENVAYVGENISRNTQRIYSLLPGIFLICSRKGDM